MKYCWKKDEPGLVMMKVFIFIKTIIFKILFIHQLFDLFPFINSKFLFKEIALRRISEIYREKMAATEKSYLQQRQTVCKN